MPAPTIVAQYSTSYTTTGTSKNVSVSWNDNETLLIVGQGGKNASLNIAAASGVTFLTSFGGGNGTTPGYRYSWATNLTSGSNVTITMTEANGTDYWGFTCFVIRNCFNVSRNGLNSSGNAPNSSYTNKYSRTILLKVITDASGADGSSRGWRTVEGTTPTSGNGYELLYQRVANNLGAYIAYYPLKLQGTRNVGMTAPIMDWAMELLELSGDDNSYNLRDNISKTSITVGDNTSSTENTPSRKANYCLVAAASVGVRPVNGTDTNVTTTMSYGGVPMTSAVKVHSNGGSQGYVELFYIVDPKPGDNNLQVDASANVDLGMGYAYFGNVNQANPIAEIITATGSSASASASFTQGNSRTSIFAAMVSANTISTPTNGGTGVRITSSITTGNTSSDAGNNAYQSIASPVQNQTVGWTLTSGPWAIVAISLAPASYFPPGAIYNFRA